MATRQQGWHWCRTDKVDETPLDCYAMASNVAWHARMQACVGLIRETSDAIVALTQKDNVMYLRPLFRSVYNPGISRRNILVRTR